MRRLLALGWIAAGAPLAAAAEEPSPAPAPSIERAAPARPAVARAELVAESGTRSGGLVFFVRIDAGAGIAAVGSATRFGRAELAGAQRVEFLVGPEPQLVATSNALLAPPGWPARAGTPAESAHLVYALDARPAGVTPLEARAEPPPPVGARVRLLGLSDDGAHEEQRLGRIVEASAQRVQVALDRPASFEAWAGAPLLPDTGLSLWGTLAAATAPGPVSRVAVVPAAGLARALARPLEHGAGRAFARFGADALPMAPAGAKLIAPSSRQAMRVELEIEQPADASVLGASACGIFVAGRAEALWGERRGFDVAIVIDTSASTIEPTGADVNGNGIVGSPSLGPVGSLFDAAGDDPGDSILAAEVAAARGLLRQLDPRSTRVALVTFAGEIQPITKRFLFFTRAAPPPARTRQALTRDFARIEQALDELLAEAPQGVTHMAAGVDQASDELLGLRGARSQPDARTEKVMLFLTDGQPTLPFGPGKDAENVRAVLAAAERARAGGIRVHAFAIGPEALAGPIATVELAARTHGYFIPVRQPGELVDVVEAVRFPDLRDIVVRSATTGEPAHPFRSDPDGSFSGLVPGVTGENRIEIVARAEDGTFARRELRVRLDPTAPAPVLPPELAAPRNALLEECLREARDQRLRVEREQAERVRRELLVEIEREREKARARAAEQRKLLQLELETPEPE
jgi:hypothetical protein